MLVVNHYLAFQHFSAHYFSFSEVIKSNNFSESRISKNTICMIPGTGIFYYLYVAGAIHTFRVIISQWKHPSDSVWSRKSWFV